MYDELSVLAIRPTERENDASIDPNFISIVDDYVELCKQYHIYVPKAAQAIYIKLSPRMITHFFNPQWKQEVRNFIKILDKQTVSIIVVDTNLIPLPLKNCNEAAKLYSAIAAAFFKCGYNDDFKLGMNYAKNKQIVFLGGTDDAYIVKNDFYSDTEDYYIIPATMKD